MAWRNKLVGVITIIVCTYFWMFNTSFFVYAANTYKEGPYTNGGDKIEISSNATFTNFTRTFNKGDTVYMRITTTRFTNGVVGNILRLRSNANAILVSSTFTQKTVSSPFVFEGQVVIPATQAEFLFVEGDIQWGTKVGIKTTIMGKVNTTQSVEITGLDQYFHFYEDAGTTIEKYAFLPTATLYGKIWGTGANFNLGSVSLKKLDGTKNLFTPSAVAKNGNWYTVTFTPTGYGFTDGWWYMAEAILKDAASATIAYNNAFFVIDSTLPTALITSPLASSTINSQTLITGSAQDATFRYYQLFVEDKAAPGVWAQIGTNTLTPVANSTLYTWDIAPFIGKVVNIKLVCRDWAGNEKTAIVSSVTVEGKLSFISPSLVTMPEVTSTTRNQTSIGYMGDATGVGALSVKDERMSKLGWTVTMSFSHFVSPNQQIPVTSLTIVPGSIQAKSGSTAGLIKGSRHTFTSEADTTLLMSAPVGFGMGNYWQQQTFELIIPANSIAGDFSSTAVITVQ